MTSAAMLLLLPLLLLLSRPLRNAVTFCTFQEIRKATIANKMSQE
jgi:hypothetical protein